MFSKNTPSQEKKEVMSALRVSNETISEKYLGLPVFIGKSKSKVFQYLKERIRRKIQGWKERMLSCAGKEILIKVVAQAIPIYAMACFDITKSLCDQISAMICRYCWSQMAKENKIHWISWEKLVLPKREGGLGFRDLHCFNLAMLAKRAWRLIQHPDSLCAQVLAAKYSPHGKILKATTMKRISYSWRSILKGVKVLNEGVIWRVGNGLNINIWNDPWLP